MYQSFVFLEVRVLILSDEKAFCHCRSGSSSESCDICSRASASPILKESVARTAYLLARSLHCNLISKAEYEYPTGTPVLPEGHCLCGSSVKVAEKGWLDIEFHKRKKTVPILEVRVEESAGKLIHTDNKTFMDYSTVGMPSIRIRTGNNLELGEEAETFLTELKNSLRYSGIITDTQGTHIIRCNAYTASTTFPNTPQHYVKLRNLNSFNYVRQAINAELRRQETVLRRGKTLISESRLWNVRQGRTDPYKLREFIDSVQVMPVQEKRYYDLPPSLLDDILHTISEGQQERVARYVKQYGLSLPIAQALCQDITIAAFFENTVSLGITPKLAADCLLSDVTGLLKKENKTLADLLLAPEAFAQILSLLEDDRVTRAIVRKFLHTVISQNTDGTALLEDNEWKKISDKTALLNLIQAMLSQHPEEVEALKSGAVKNLDVLAGFIMKETGGFADQKLVKQLIKEELNISVVYVLAMGGAISGEIRQGEIKDGNIRVLETLLDDDIADRRICFETVAPEGLLSEELEPGDWARLIHMICEKIASGTANGIVLTHGTDTLVYTAPLIYWLFADTPVPIVLTASNTAPENAGSGSNEARRNLNDAIRVALQKKDGVFVSMGDKLLSPLNLKFIGSSGAGFVNWNIEKPVFKGKGLLTEYEETDILVFEGLLSEAARKMFLIKTYPGIRSEYLLDLLKKKELGIFFLELYEKGTANMRESPYSLKEFLRRGKKYGCRFYCTSQQEESVDFSGYVSARRVWKEGAVPMGFLTTETAIALYYSASLVCDSLDELDEIMESAGLIDEKTF